MAASWHRILLICVLLAITGLAVWFALSYPGAIQDLQAPLNKQAPGNKVAPLSADTVLAQRDQWLNPAPWSFPDTQNQLFTSRGFLYFTATQKVEVETPDTTVTSSSGHSIPLAWLNKNGLNASDSDIIDADSDGDGFSNFEEYTAGTDPRDPKSHPSYVKLVRLQSSDSRPFRLTFTSLNAVGDDNFFQISTPDGQRQSNNAKIGDTFEGFKVIKYTPKQGNRMIGTMTVEGDISELELQNVTTGADVVLVLHDEQNVPNVSAVFMLLLANAYTQPITVGQGRDFTFQAQPRPDIPAETVHLQFVSLGADGATVVVPETKEKLVIPQVTPDELNRVKTAAAQAAAPASP